MFISPGNTCTGIGIELKMLLRDDRQHRRTLFVHDSDVHNPLPITLISLFMLTTERARSSVPKDPSDTRFSVRSSIEPVEMGLWERRRKKNPVPGSTCCRDPVGDRLRFVIRTRVSIRRLWHWAGPGQGVPAKEISPSTFATPRSPEADRHQQRGLGKKRSIISFYRQQCWLTAAPQFATALQLRQTSRPITSSTALTGTVYFNRIFWQYLSDDSRPPVISAQNSRCILILMPARATKTGVVSYSALTGFDHPTRSTLESILAMESGYRSFVSSFSFVHESDRHRCLFLMISVATLPRGFLRTIAISREHWKDSNWDSSNDRERVLCRESFFRLLDFLGFCSFCREERISEHLWGTDSHIPQPEDADSTLCLCFFVPIGQDRWSYLSHHEHMSIRILHDVVKFQTVLDQ